MTRTTFRMAVAAIGGLTLAAATTIGAAAVAPKFFNDDPLWVVRDTQDASGITPMEVNLFVDLSSNIIRGMAKNAPERAKNLNTIDEVPDSSWYTNRVGTLAISEADIARGPNTTDGPAKGPWTVTSSKSDGVTPGFTITDAAGQRWFLKFDPRGYRGMATGTEVAVTKLMWALGYNVPENHIAYLDRRQLVVGPTAKFTPMGSTPRRMRDDDIDALLKRVDREADGTYRIVASKALPGKPVGRIQFFGTRTDDPNDVVPHEDRRELRGYGVFAAWLNHVDAKAINSLDTLVTEDGRGVVRHHLIDFGSAMGSGGVAPADYWAGDEYLLEPGKVGAQMIGFGFRRASWHSDRFRESRAVGRLREQNATFDPAAWKPRVPNQAFLHARDDDRFWAARKLAAMDTNLTRAAVRTGEFGDPQAEEFLVRALAERRDAILRAYLPAVNPVAGVTLSAGGELAFTNAAVDADVARAPQAYVTEWMTFDNATRATTPLGAVTGRSTSVQGPARLPTAEGAYLKVELGAIGGPAEAWSVPVDAYFRRIGGQWKLIGFERLATE